MAEQSLIDLVKLPLTERIDLSGYYLPPAPDYQIPAVSPAHAAKNFLKTKLIPDRPLAEGEQYRFHFDATKCIGCECCVVACNEQNNNPADVTWRRVGEIEAGVYPETKRLYLSMGCNHCLEPSCMSGCPTKAYSKDEKTGLVLHNADSCIGCQYCVWNCPYGVPQYNSERHVVTKCDMCSRRLAEGHADPTTQRAAGADSRRTPACAEACPEGAISIEIIDKEEWRKEHHLADAPGMPDAAQTISTTRITLPADVRENGMAVSAYNVQPEHAHASLVFFLCLTQLSVGGFIALWLTDFLAQTLAFFTVPKTALMPMAVGMFAAAALSLGTAVLHLGRPIMAWKALRNLKSSWLSREILLFSSFSLAAGAYAGLFVADAYALLRVTAPLRLMLGGVVALSGIIAILSSAFIYMVPARPAWYTPATVYRFLATAFTLGPTVVALLLQLAGVASSPLYFFTLIAGGVQMTILARNFLHLGSSTEHELKGTARLLTINFRRLFYARLITLFAAAILLPLVLVRLGNMLPPSVQLVFGGFALVMLAFSEFAGRYLFFVTVVPKNMAGGFFSGKK
ncbi:MAG: dimethyl sulfoxide reductase anchor subunit [Leptospiraceae bacterium]|nr:dimethyl sulfoxide reductase anchor subunit [Leptospiraceae bacterium]